MKSTEKLLNEIKETKEISEYLNNNIDEIHIGSLSDFLNKTLAEKGLSRADVVKKSNLNKPYVYQIFAGKRYPSKDKIISLAFGMDLDVSETQILLKRAGYCELFPRNKRDALILFAIENKKTIVEVNELLYDYEVEVLE